MQKLHPLVVGGTRVLAPLVGGSDLAFRLLCRKYGAEVTFTEMIQASYFNNVDMVKKSGSTQVDFHESDRPLILQVAANVDEADEVIKMVNNPIFAGHIDGVDLNCGCPQGFAMKRGIGAALFRFPDQYVELVRKIAAGIPYPLSVKCRMHEDGVESTIELLRRVVDAGAVAITLHGRNWTQRGQNRGKTDYEGMCAVRKGLPESLAFVANGDIQEFDDFERVMKLTGARAGMSGYGALLDPGAVFSPKDKRPTLQQMIQDYLDLARQHRNLLVDVQRHLAWLLKRAHPDKSLKAELFRAASLADVVLFLKQLDIHVHVPDEGKIVGPPRVEDLVDPKHKKRAAKKLRRAERKAEDKKRSREEKLQQQHQQQQQQEEEERLKKGKIDE